MPALFEIAAIAAAAALGHQTVQSAPLRLSVDQDGAMTVVRVVGLSEAPFSANYALEVSQRNGANRSVQRGTAQLQPNSESILATVRLSSAIADVEAKLTVIPNGAPEYSQSFGSSPVLR